MRIFFRCAFHFLFAFCVAVRFVEWVCVRYRCVALHVWRIFKVFLHIFHPLRCLRNEQLCFSFMLSVQAQCKEVHTSCVCVCVQSSIFGNLFIAKNGEKLTLNPIEVEFYISFWRRKEKEKRILKPRRSATTFAIKVYVCNNFDHNLFKLEKAYSETNFIQYLLWPESWINKKQWANTRRERKEERKRVGKEQAVLSSPSSWHLRRGSYSQCCEVKMNFKLK